MPIIKSAIKRAKQTIKRRARNVGIKHDIKEATKAFMAKPSAKTLSAAQSEIDTAVKKGLIKKNTAARRKVNLSKFAKESKVVLAGTSKKVVAKAEPKVTAAPAVAKKTVAKKPATKPAAVKKAPTKTAVKKPVAKKVTK